MAEGIFPLKETESGWRHYIELPNGDHDDINCGSALEVQLGRWEVVPDGEKLVPDRWVAGRYEADLRGDERDVKAFLCIGYFYLWGAGMACRIPLGVRVRRPEERVR